MKDQHPLITKSTQALCRSCGKPIGNLNYGTGSTPAFCGKQACLAKGIRAYWQTLGFKATVQYGGWGSPRLVSVPVKM